MNYQRIYNQIVEKAKLETEDRIDRKKRGEYFEGHHIIPKCLGGQGNSKQYRHENIVVLTAREHFLCHWLLHEIYPENKELIFAFNMLCNFKNYKINNSRVFDYIKNEASKQTSKMLSGRISPNKGKKHPEQSKRMSGDKNPMFGKGYLFSKEKSPFFGKKQSQETIEKKASKIRGRQSPKKGKLYGKQKNPMKNKGPQPTVECPICKKIGGVSLMKRYHFNNCKNKNQ